MLLTDISITKVQSTLVISLIVLGFHDTSNLVGHFVWSSRERVKRDRRDSRRDEREGQGRKRNRNESEETDKTRASAQRFTNTPSWRNFLIIKYFKVNNNDIRQDIVYTMSVSE